MYQQMSTIFAQAAHTMHVTISTLLWQVIANQIICLYLILHSDLHVQSTLKNNISNK